MNLFEYYQQNDEVKVILDERYGLASVKYLHLGVDWSAPHMLDARGLIINTEGEIIGRPYQKFFNYHQLKEFNNLPDKIKKLSDWKDGAIKVMDKADGSLVIAYTYNDQLFLSSSGSVDGFPSQQFKECLNTYPKETTEKLKKYGETLTIIMEFVSPRQQIVLNYPVEKFIIHGARNTKTGKYLSFDELILLANDLKIELIEVYPNINNLEDLLSNLNELKEKEGFVVAWDDGYRLKFKTDEYVNLHQFLTPLVRNESDNFKNRLIDMLAEDKLDDLLSKINEIESDVLREKALLSVNSIIDLFKDFKIEYDLFYSITKNLVNHKMPKNEFIYWANELAEDSMFSASSIYKIFDFVKFNRRPEFLDLLKERTSIFRKDFLKTLKKNNDN